MIRTLNLLFCFLLVCWFTKNKRLVSSSSMWILCYCLIFVFYPSVKEFDNEELIDIIGFVALCFFSVGQLFGTQISIKQKRTILDNKVKWQVSRKMARAFCVLTSMSLLATFGVQRVFLFFSNMNTMEVIRGDGYGLYNLYNIFLSIYSTSILLLVVSEKPEENYKCELIFHFVMFGIFTIIFAFARKYLIYTTLMILVFYLRDLKIRKQMQIIICSFVAGVVAMVIMGYIRSYGIGKISEMGEYFSNIKLDLQYLLKSLDFGAAYETFSQIMSSKHVSVSPIVYLKPLFAIIPRSVWGGKPLALSVQVNNIINPHYADTNMSTGLSFLGEAYVIMGYVGFIVYPLIWGGITAQLDKKYSLRKADKTYWTILYYAFLVTYIIESHRGDTTAATLNFIYSFVIPIIILNTSLVRKKIKLRI